MASNLRRRGWHERSSCGYDARCPSHAPTRRPARVCKLGSMRDRALGCTTEPLVECLHQYHIRASCRGRSRDPVPTLARGQYECRGSLCCAPNLSIEEANVEGGRGCIHVVAFRPCLRRIVLPSRGKVVKRITSARILRGKIDFPLDSTRLHKCRHASSDLIGVDRTWGSLQS